MTDELREEKMHSIKDEYRYELAMRRDLEVFTQHMIDTYREYFKDLQTECNNYDWDFDLIVDSIKESL